MDMQNFSGRRSFPRLACVALTGLLAAAGAALAAPCADDDCRSAARDLMMSPHGNPGGTLDLAVRSVDLGDAETDAAAAAPDSAAPLLYLTPRVASILEDVFGEEASAAEIAPAVEPEAPPAAPLAGARNEPEPESLGPLVPADGAAQVPRFQRQMFRTDI